MLFCCFFLVHTELSIWLLDKRWAICVPDSRHNIYWVLSVHWNVWSKPCSGFSLAVHHFRWSGNLRSVGRHCSSCITKHVSKIFGIHTCNVTTHLIQFVTFFSFCQPDTCQLPPSPWGIGNGATRNWSRLPYHTVRNLAWIREPQCDKACPIEALHLKAIWAYDILF